MNGLVGKTVGNYRITEEIGGGGMGKVYKAIHLTLDRIVAVKMIHPRLVGDSGIISRFYKEAKIQAQLNHPNIVTVYDFLEVESGYFIVMEYVHGESLGKVLSRQGAFEPRIAISIFRQILSGVRYAHSKGVVHRDIKPNNFLLTPSFVKITDFGIAQIICDTGLTMTGNVLGTPKYMSPEQILGKKTDHRTDVYSLGVTFYEMLTGRIPFGGGSSSDYEIKKGHVELQPPPISRVKPDVPVELESIVLRALLKRPEERFQSVDELRSALERIHNGKREIMAEADSLNLTDINLVERSGETGKSLENLSGEEELDEKGDLNVTPYPALLLSFHREKRTGFLILDSEVKLKVYFLEGIIIFTEGEDSRLALGEMLVNKAKITKTDQEEALSFAHDTGVKIGEALIKLGKVTPHELNSTLEKQIKEKLIEGFRCKSGLYGFKNTSNFTIEAAYRIHPVQVMYEGVNRFIKNGEIPNNSFYDVSSSIHPKSDIKEELRDVVLSSPKELKLAHLLRGGLTLKDIISISPLSASDTLRFLYFLNLAQLLEIRGKDLASKGEKQIKREDEFVCDKTRLLTEQEIKTLKEEVGLRGRPKRH